MGSPSYNPSLEGKGDKGPAWGGKPPGKLPLGSSLKLALAFLTVLPVPAPVSPGERHWRRAVVLFPVVGVFLGGVLALVDFIARLPGEEWRSASAALVLTACFLLTGGLHHDGLADVADAFLGARGREERLRIMKDPSVGALGVSSLCLYILLAWSLLKLLPTGPGWGGYRAASLVCVPSGGRTVMAWLCCRSPYARDEGKAMEVVVNAGRREMALLAVIYPAISVSLMGLVGSSFSAGMALPLVALAVAEIIAFYLRRQLGGVTGDLLGASGLLAEVLLLLVLVAWPAGRFP